MVRKTIDLATKDIFYLEEMVYVTYPYYNMVNIGESQCQVYKSPKTTSDLGNL